MAKSDSGSFAQVMADLKAKKYYPIYFLMGEEPYYIDQIAGYIAENVLSEDEKVFNQAILYGKDVDIRTVINSAKQYPMMAERRVVVVKEAQNIREQQFDDMLFYAQKPQESTVLVFCYKYKKLDMRKKYAAEMAKVGLVFESKPLYENQVPAFIKNYLKEKNRTIDEKSVQLLTSYLGNDLQHIISELEKLSIADGSSAVTPESIERNVGISKAFNDFELVDALGERNALKAYRIVNYFAKSQQGALPRVLINLFNFYVNLLIYRSLMRTKSDRDIAAEMRINPFFVSRYKTAAARYSTHAVLAVISLIREYDAKGKGVDCGRSVSAGLLEELVGRILMTA